MKKMKGIVAVVLLLLGSVSFAQTTDLSKTFEIHCQKPSDVKKYHDAAMGNNQHSDGNLDMYRFYDKRRTIEFTGTSDYIVLLSAKELYEKYGKPISPLTIREGQAYREITFAVNLDGIGFKPQFR